LNFAQAWRPRMHILLNGEPKSLEKPVSVAALLEQMGMTGKRVAVEVNREIVPRSRHADLQLRDHDHVEIVAAIGGG
jgi:sulfur carrier protein